jgi:cytochrome c553
MTALVGTRFSVPAATNHCLGMIRRAAWLAVLLGSAFGGPFAYADPSALALGRHLSHECSSCHRAATENSAIPALAGRPARELAALLREYQSGARTNAVMVSVAQSLNDTEIAAISAYFETLATSAKP